jgi:hypothetical protein
MKAASDWLDYSAPVDLTAALHPPQTHLLS